MHAQSISASVVYKDIPDFPGYRVGEIGSVLSAWKVGGRIRPEDRLGDEWRPIQPSKVASGHLKIWLKQGESSRYMFVHHLVLMAFVGPCPPGMECCHEEGVPDNNRLGNLRWDTRKANQADSQRHGTRAVGVRQGKAKLCDDKVRIIRRLSKQGLSGTSLARRFGVSQSLISAILLGQKWRHVEDMILETLS